MKLGIQIYVICSCLQAKLSYNENNPLYVNNLMKTLDIPSFMSVKTRLEQPQIFRLLSEEEGEEASREQNTQIGDGKTTAARSHRENANFPLFFDVMHLVMALFGSEEHDNIIS